MFFQRKNPRKVKDSDGSQKENKDSRGKNNLFDRAKGGLGALAESLQSAKNARAEKLQEDVKAGIETILHKGSDILGNAKEEIGGHLEASRSKEQEQGSEEQESQDMETFSAVIDNVKNHPEVVEKVKEEVMSLAEALHMGKHESTEKESESQEKAKEGETTQNVDESASANKTEGPSAVEQAAEEIQAVVAAVQQQTTRAETGTPTETATETSAERGMPEETKAEVEKDDPKKRIDFFGFFAMLFERFCSPANKKKDSV